MTAIYIDKEIEAALHRHANSNKSETILPEYNTSSPYMSAVPMGQISHPNARHYIYLRYSFLANVNSSSCSLYVIVGPSVVCLSSVTFVRPTQTIEIFRNVSTP